MLKIGGSTQRQDETLRKENQSKIPEKYSRNYNSGKHSSNERRLENGKGVHIFYLRMLV